MLKFANENVTDVLKVNVKIAESQEEFITIPAHKTKTGIYAYAMELTEADIEKIKKEKKIYIARIVGSGDFQPFNIALDQETFHDEVQGVDYDLQVYDVIAKIVTIGFNDQSIKEVNQKAAYEVSYAVVDAAETYVITDEALWDKYIQKLKEIERNE